ncbi:MAG: ribosome maturation factor RimM [Bacteroidota bacterium]
MELTQIGKILKAHGLKGEMKCAIEEAFLEDALQAEAFFLQQKGQHLPYFIQSLRVGNATILALEEIDSKEIAMSFRNAPIFMRTADLLPIEDRNINNLLYDQYEGFQLKDTERGIIGVIEEVLEMPQQEMAVVHYRNKEVLIPLHEAMILNVSEEEKILEVVLPEGLLEL